MRVVGTHIDIIKEKKTRQKLVESEKRFRELIEHLPSGVTVFKAINEGDDFEFVDYNSAAEKIIGKTLLECFPRMKESPLFKALQKVHKYENEVFIPPFYYKDEFGHILLFYF